MVEATRAMRELFMKAFLEWVVIFYTLRSIDNHGHRWEMVMLVIAAALLGILDSAFGKWLRKEGWYK